MQNLQFALEFGHKNIVIRFNDSNSFHTVGEGAPWESVPFMNAITHLMNKENPLYAVMEAGMYLHKSLPEIVDMLKNGNVGLVSHVVLEEMIEARLVRRDLEIKPGVYRLAWNGLFLTASDMPYRPYDPNESAQVAHNRDAFKLFMAFETIRKAAEQGKNIRLLTTEKLQPRVEFFHKLYGLFLAGDFTTLAAEVKKGIDKAKLYETVKHYGKRSAAAVEKGKEFAAPESLETLTGTVAAASLVGKKVQFVMGTTTLPIEWTVTDGVTVVEESVINLGDIAATMKERGVKLHVVVAEGEQPAEKKAPRKARTPRKNVPVAITE